jgi:hypothetical protein
MDGVMVAVQRHPQLKQIVPALSPPRRLARLLDGGQQ